MPVLPPPRPPPRPSPPGPAITAPAANRPLSRSRRLTATGAPSSIGDEKYVAGSVIAGRYRLERVIGQGGMGSVWLARNLTLDIDVAIKLIRRDRAAAEAPMRLLQEARATARIGHPSIVRIFDFGETEQQDPFIVMEVLTGESLADVMDRKGKLPAIIAVQTLLPIASALVAAHAKGIVHRDLKPENIMLVHDDAGSLIPKVVDFGIARLRSTDQERRYTLAGELLGSPDYMSPEQARGEADVDERADVWALAVLLYELTCGARPFDAPNYNALLMQILLTEPVPAPQLSDADPMLWAIIERGLAKDRERRWPTMRELGAALAAWSVERGVDEDVAGTSLPAHWLAGHARRPLSRFPPGSSPDRSSASPPDRASASSPDRASAPMPLGSAAQVDARASMPVSLSPPVSGPIAGAWSAPSPPSSRGLLLVVGVGLAVLLCAGLSVILLVRARVAHTTPADPAPTQLSAASLPVAPATSAPAVEPEPEPAASAVADPDPAAGGSDIDDPPASASASAGAGARPRAGKPPRRRAPPAPKNITF